MIRSALDSFTVARPPRPTWPLVRGAGRTDIARRVDDVLADGFGRD